jgi:hypothetical protein
VTARRRRRCGLTALARGQRDRGSVTAELAAALPALMVFTVVALGAVDAVTQKLECLDAARDAALAAARGSDGEAAGRARAPAGALVSVAIDGDTARAVVVVRVHPMGRYGPGVDVTGTAAASVEPGGEGE